MYKKEKKTLRKLRKNRRKIKAVTKEIKKQTIILLQYLLG